ncbi:hypothetical protein Franean1_1243 [Parafrankia sp. EAN1pec]|nr:hypothetical protein Franean1_1243 [Frankia sp. EAN1pec]
MRHGRSRQANHHSLPDLNSAVSKEQLGASQINRSYAYRTSRTAWLAWPGGTDGAGGPAPNGVGGSGQLGARRADQHLPRPAYKPARFTWNVPEVSGPPPDAVPARATAGGLGDRWRICRDPPRRDLGCLRLSRARAVQGPRRPCLRASSGPQSVPVAFVAAFRGCPPPAPPDRGCFRPG